MPRAQATETQIATALREVEAGSSVSEVARH